jgi:hypothetical protein
VDIGDVTVETFAGREGERFTVQFADAALELELAEVAPVPGHWGRTEKRVPFSALFHGPAEHMLPQQTWLLDHDELGRLEVFLVPIEARQEDGVVVYEAVFN